MDRRTDAQVHGKIVLLLHSFIMRGSDVAILVKFRPVVYEEIV